MLKKTLFVIVFLALLSGCSSAGGIKHTVQKGETFWRICHTYNVDAKRVARVNGIKDTTRIRAGQKIFIPGAKYHKRVAIVDTKKKGLAGGKRSASLKNSSRAGGKSSRKASSGVTARKGRLSWPVQGNIISTFGVKNGSKNDGIDIKARRGTPVKASDGGVVAHTASGMRFFGNIVIIKHSNDLYTLYAHNEENLVETGDKVTRGEVIAKVGSSGEANVSKLHFEVRDGRTVRNPLFFLP